MRYAAFFVALLVTGAAPQAHSFCGCDKPPPPRAVVRPFMGYAEQTITLFDERLVAGNHYTVQFTSRDGASDWSRGKVASKKDFADGALRNQLRVTVPNVALGPAQISVYDGDTLVYTLDDSQFTVIAEPIPLHDFEETITRDEYQTGVGADGTVYLAFDLSEMSNATSYSGVAIGYPFRFEGRNVAIFNAQGFLGEVLDPNSRGLFRLTSGGPWTSTALDYWRHEFRTYKEDHRKRDARRTADGEWHADGTPHVDNYHLVVAISGTLASGEMPQPGPTPPFRLVLTSTPAPTNNLP
jgi:hypothetical protein